MDPNEVARHMDGLLQDASPGRTEALLPSPMIQNHAAFLHFLADGALACAWFGGTLEGKSDISIFASVPSRSGVVSTICGGWPYFGIRSRPTSRLNSWSVPPSSMSHWRATES